MTRLWSSGPGYAIGPLDGRWTVRAARDDAGDALRSALHARNAAATQRSRTVLDRLFGSGAAFVEPAAETRTSSTRADVVADLVTFADVDALVRHSDGSPSRLLAYHGLDAVEPNQALAAKASRFRPGPLNANGLIDALGRGFTFNLLGIDQEIPVLGELAEHVERATSCQVEISAFLSGGTTASTPFHADHPDLIVLPTTGPKYWEVRRCRVDHPMLGTGATPDDGGEAFAGVLRPGTALAVPRAWIHRAETRGEPAICLTLGLHRPFGASAVVEQLNGAVAQPAMRRAFTLTADLDPAACHDLLDPLAVAAGTRLRASDLRDAFARQLASVTPRPGGRAHWPLADAGPAPARLGHHAVRARVPGGCHGAEAVEPGRAPEGARSIAAGGRVITAARAQLDVALWALSGEVRSHRECLDLPADGLELVTALVVEGLVELVDERVPGLEARLASSAPDPPP